MAAAGRDPRARLARRRRRRSSFDAQVFRPSAGPRDLVMVQKSEVIGHLSPVIGLYTDLAFNPLALVNNDTNSTVNAVTAGAHLHAHRGHRLLQLDRRDGRRPARRLADGRRTSAPSASEGPVASNAHRRHAAPGAARHPVPEPQGRGEERLRHGRRRQRQPAHRQPRGLHGRRRGHRRPDADRRLPLRLRPAPRGQRGGLAPAQRRVPRRQAAATWPRSASARRRTSSSARASPSSARCTATPRSPSSPTQPVARSRPRCSSASAGRASRASPSPRAAASAPRAASARRRSGSSTASPGSRRRRREQEEINRILQKRERRPRRRRPHRRRRPLPQPGRPAGEPRLPRHRRRRRRRPRPHRRVPGRPRGPARQERLPDRVRQGRRDRHPRPGTLRHRQGHHPRRVDARPRRGGQGPRRQPGDPRGAHRGPHRHPRVRRVQHEPLPAAGEQRDEVPDAGGDRPAAPAGQGLRPHRAGLRRHRLHRARRAAHADVPDDDVEEPARRLPHRAPRRAAADAPSRARPTRRCCRRRTRCSPARRVLPTQTSVLPTRSVLPTSVLPTAGSNAGLPQQTHALPDKGVLPRQGTIKPPEEPKTAPPPKGQPKPPVTAEPPKQRQSFRDAELTQLGPHARLRAPLHDAGDRLERRARRRTASPAPGGRTSARKRSTSAPKPTPVMNTKPSACAGSRSSTARVERLAATCRASGDRRGSTSKRPRVEERERGVGAVGDDDLVPAADLLGQRAGEGGSSSTMSTRPGAAAAPAGSGDGAGSSGASPCPAAGRLMTKRAPGRKRRVGARTDRALDGDGAAGALDDLAADREAEARAHVGALRGEERLPDALRGSPARCRRPCP